MGVAGRGRRPEGALEGIPRGWRRRSVKTDEAFLWLGVQSAHRTEEKGAGTHLHEDQAARGSSSESDPESTIAHTRRCPVVYIRGRGCGRGCERERLSRVGESNRA